MRDFVIANPVLSGAEGLNACLLQAGSNLLMFNSKNFHASPAINNMRIKVKVKPNANKNELKEISPGFFEARVSVPPEKGKANQRVIELLAKHFKVPKSTVSLISGLTFKEKVFEIE